MTSNELCKQEGVLYVFDPYWEGADDDERIDEIYEFFEAVPIGTPIVVSKLDYEDEDDGDRKVHFIASKILPNSMMRKIMKLKEKERE